MTSLRLFGNLELSDREGGSVPLQAKRGAILAYLAIARPGPWHRRDTLLALFWPESDEERGRSALSKAVYYLRRSAGPDLVLGRGDQELGLSTSSFWCDVTAFEDAIRRGALGDALAIYRGHLLEGFHLAGAPDFSHWLDTERNRLHRHALNAVWGLVDEGEATGSVAEATKWARQALVWSPTDETGLRRLLGLLHRQGKRTEAITTYESFRTRCRDGYGIEPSEATGALIEAIRDGSLPPPSSPPPAGRTSGSPEEAPHEGAGADPGPPVEPIPAASTVPTRHAWRSAIRGRIGLLGLTSAILIAFFAIPMVRNGAERGEIAVGSPPPKDRIVLSEFSDGTGENLGRVVTEALRIDLQEASQLDLAEAADIAPILRLMRLEAGAPLTAERARQVAIRMGIGAVIDGEVARAGSGYILTAVLRDSDTGRSTASFRVTAAGPGDFIGSIDQLSENMREGSGEPLLAIRAGRPLEQATTPSLEALRLYTQAVAAFDLGDARGSTELLELALARDSTFAMAWRMLGLLSGGRDAATKAFQYRHRLSDVERYLVEGRFDSSVAGDRLAAMEAYRNALRVNPDEPRALNNLAALHRGLSEMEPALELYRRAVAGPGRTSSSYGNLVGTLIFAGFLEEAATALRGFEEAYPGHGMQVGLHFALSFAQGDMDSAADYAGGRFDDVGRMNDARDAVNQGRLARWAGRLSEARSLYLRAEALRARESPYAARQARASTAYEEALAGGETWAREHVRGGSFAGPSLRSAALALAYSGDAEAAEALIREWEGRTPEGLKGPSTRNGIARVHLYARVERGDTVGAVETMRNLLLEAGCSDVCWPFDRARLHDRLGAHDEAIELYERVRLPGYSYGADSDDVIVGERLYAMMRLGPLYEESGDTAKAIKAYQRMANQWADGDARAMQTVSRFRERIVALGG